MQDTNKIPGLLLRVLIALARKRAKQSRKAKIAFIILTIKVFFTWIANKRASLKAGRKIFTCWGITIRTQSMDKEKLRIFLGQLIDLQVMFENMKTSGLSWDNVQEIQDNLRCIIIDLENAID